MKKCENCNPFENYDALVILTRQGCVMTSDDAQLTFDEDAQLYKLNKSIADRTEGNELYQLCSLLYSPENADVC